MAAQAVRNLFNLLIYPFVDPETATDATVGLFGVHPTPNELSVCNTRCQSAHPPIARRRPLPWPIPNPPGGFNILAGGNPIAPAVHPVCNNRADWAPNPATGLPEPSWCKEHMNIPSTNPPSHRRPQPEGARLSCLPCKTARYEDRLWRQEAIQIGACQACQKWVLANLKPGQSDCICPPVGNNTNGWNNNEPRQKHLCRIHDSVFWNRVILPRTRREIERRRRLQRTPYKKRGHGWTHKKGPKPVKTPTERAKATRLEVHPFAGGPALAPDPRCFCGNFLTHEHTRMPLAVGPRPRWTSQIRNCAGCDKFVRNW